MLVFVSVQLDWPLLVFDVTAAFLQGENLPPERDVYMKVPPNWPKSVLQLLFGIVVTLYQRVICRCCRLLLR